MTKCTGRADRWISNGHASNRASAHCFSLYEHRIDTNFNLQQKYNTFMTLRESPFFRLLYSNFLSELLASRPVAMRICTLVNICSLLPRNDNITSVTNLTGLCDFVSHSLADSKDLLSHSKAQTLFVSNFRSEDSYRFRSTYT